MIALVVLVALAGADRGDPCAPPFDRGGAASDAAEAPLYRRVGDEEAAAGNADAAITAYGEALRRDPRDARARAGLVRLCRTRAAASAADAFDEGVERMQRADRAAAVAAFEQARADGADPAAALLEGICEFERGRERRARSLFEEARADSGTAGPALFFLGLIALHEGESERAYSLLASAAASDDRIADRSWELMRVARRDGRVVLSALSEAGFDSNVSLAPDGSALAGGAADGYGVGVAGIFFRPLGIAGPYARVTAQYRKQLQSTAYDLGGVAGALGFRAGPGRRYLAAEYDYDFLSLGGTPYLSAHRLLAIGRLWLGALDLVGLYAARFESFLPSTTSGYSGWRQEVQATVEWAFSRALVLGAGYRLARDDTRDAVLGYTEQGPFTVFWLGLGAPLRLLAEAHLTFRDYDQIDPAFALARADRYIDASLSGELDLGDHTTLRLTVTGRRALSNVAELQYSKLTTGLALVYTTGLL
jgi:tetratricopeptide (TPR) repeat protein